tara:strand:- start:77 stop:259 length:183 start_codon:yes stop_codon:yes gene_type:complete
MMTEKDIKTKEQFIDELGIQLMDVLGVTDETQKRQGQYILNRIITESILRTNMVFSPPME